MQDIAKLRWPLILTATAVAAGAAMILASRHLVQAAETAHRQLAAQQGDLRTRISLNLGAEPYTEEVRRIAVVHHRKLVAAIEAGRADDAAAIAAVHFSLSEKLMREIVARANLEEAKPRP